MSLLKTRPAIRVRLPRVVQAGTECVAEVQLLARRTVPIDAVSVRLIGIEKVASGESGESLTLITLGAQLSGPRELPRGETRLSSRFSLPPSMPPSYKGHAAHTSYCLEVHVDIPWWPDAREQFVVHVARSARPMAAPERKPVIYSSNPKGPKGRDPYVEVSLTDKIVASGGVLVGAVALGNVAHNDYTSVMLGIVPVEVIKLGGRPLEVYGPIAEAHLPLSAVREGQAIPFRLKLADIWPTDSSSLWRLDWRLLVRAYRRFGRDHAIELPIMVVPAGEREPVPDEAGVPTLGSARVDAVWRAVAEGLGLALENDALIARAGDVSLRIWREHLGRGGLRLFAKLEYPSLGLHIDAGALGGFRRLIGTAEVGGPSAWEARHYLAGRERAQVQTLWRAWFAPMHTWSRNEALTISDLSDERLLLELNDAGQTEPALRAFAWLALALARGLPEARAQIPVPSSMQAALPAWEEMAVSLGALLERSSMSLRFTIDGQPATITTVWEASGEARHTEITLHPEPVLGTRWTLDWSEAEGITQGDLGDLPRRACDAFNALERECRAITIAPEEITALLPAPLDDPRPARSVLLSIAELADALRARLGAYR